MLDPDLANGALYCSSLSLITPTLAGFNFQALYTVKTIPTLPYLRGTLKMFPYQMLLRGGQLSLATEIKQQTHPALAFASIGLMQGVIYGHINTTWARYAKIATVTSAPMRGGIFAACRDLLSQGLPYYAGTRVNKTEGHLIVVGAVSAASVLASQGFHNYQTLMQINKRSYLGTIHHGWKTYRWKIMYAGYSSRVVIMMVTNMLNFLLLDKIW